MLENSVVYFFENTNIILNKYLHNKIGWLNSGITPHPGFYDFCQILKALLNWEIPRTVTLL